MDCNSSCNLIALGRETEESLTNVQVDWTQGARIMEATLSATALLAVPRLLSIGGSLPDLRAGAALPPGGGGGRAGLFRSLPLPPPGGTEQGRLVGTSSSLGDLGSGGAMWVVDVV